MINTKHLHEIYSDKYSQLSEAGVAEKVSDAFARFIIELEQAQTYTHDDTYKTMGDVIEYVKEGQAYHNKYTYESIAEKLEEESDYSQHNTMNHVEQGIVQ